MALSPLAVRDATGTSRNVVSHQDASGCYIPVHTSDSTVAHYSAAKTALSMVATPTTAFVIAGSATKTVRIKRITLSGAATAYASMPFTVERWSTAGTLGSAVLTAISPAKRDSTNAAATATVSTVGTANYTTKGTAAGLVAAGRLNLTALAAAATSSAAGPAVFDFTTNNDQALVLRGVAEIIAIDFAGTAIPGGGVVDFSVDWAEDAS